MQGRCLISLLLVVLTFVVYRQVHEYEFVNFDDPVYVSDNPHVNTGLTWDNVRWSTTSSYASNWFPLTWCSLMIDASVWGTDAGGFHLTNLLLHVVSVLVLFYLLEEITGAVWKSSLVAALFAIHPLHVESVAWATERKDVLSTLFGLIAIWAYCRYALRENSKWYFVSLLAFAVSLLAKQMLVTLPFLLFLLDYWPLHRLKNQSHSREGEKSAEPISSQRLIAEKIPFFVLAGLSALIVFLVQQRGGTVQTFGQVPLELRLSNAVVVYLLYIVQTFWPRNLAIFYPYPADGISLTEVLTAATLLIAITVLVFKLAKRRGYLLTGWLWYLGTLVPVIGIVQVGSQRMADRYTYFPLIGLTVAVVWLVAEIVPRGIARKYFLPAGWVAVVAVLAVLADTQIGHWRNSVTLFEHAVAVTDNNALAYTNLANAKRDLGQKNEAIALFRKALQIDPNYAVAHNNLGIELLSLRAVDEATSHFREASKIDPGYVAAFYNLGGTLRDQGQLDEAVVQFEHALHIEPESVKTLINLANVLRTQDRLREAIQHLKTACRLAPNDSAAHVNLGIIYFQQKRIDAAMEQLELGVRLDPESMSAHFNLAAALHSQNRFDEAVLHFRRALDIDPKNVQARMSLARSLTENGDLDGAIGQFQTVIKMQPENWPAHYSLAKVYVMQENFKAAEISFAKTLEYHPDFAEAHNELGSIQIKRGRYEAAIENFRKALQLKPDYPEAKRNLSEALKKE